MYDNAELTIACKTTKRNIIDFANWLDWYEAAVNELLYLDLYCLPTSSRYDFLCVITLLEIYL